MRSLLKKRFKTVYIFSLISLVLIILIMLRSSSSSTPAIELFKINKDVDPNIAINGSSQINYIAMSIGCYTEDILCVNFTNLNQIKLFNLKGDLYQEYDYEPSEGYFVDRVASIDEELNTFILREIQEKNTDQFYAQFYIYNPNDKSKTQLKLSIDGEDREEIKIDLRASMDFRDNNLLIGSDLKVKYSYELDRTQNVLTLTKSYNFGEYIADNYVVKQPIDEGYVELDNRLNEDFSNLISLELNEENNELFIRKYLTEYIESPQNYIRIIE